MKIPVSHRLKEFRFGDTALQAFVPDEQLLQVVYTSTVQAGGEPAFPYWARVWPSAVAMCRYIAKNNECFLHKQVLELGAGVGLPSLLVARWATHVIASDIEVQAVECMQRSIAHNRLQNVQACVIDWSKYNHNIAADLVLLSDVNYATDQLLDVQQRIHAFLLNGVTVILATPERIVARELISMLQAFTTERVTEDVDGTVIHILVMRGV